MLRMRLGVAKITPVWKDKRDNYKAVNPGIHGCEAYDPT